jgi:hypothetical protein
MKVPATGHTRPVIVGATGMVGGYALRYALDHRAVGRVTAIGRRKVGISHPALHAVDSLLEWEPSKKLVDIDLCAQLHPRLPLSRDEALGCQCVAPGQYCTGSLLSVPNS